MGKICVFFGHREVPKELYPRLKEAVEAAIASGVTEFWNGGYGGFDSMAQSVVNEAKREYPYILHRLVYAYPPVHGPDACFDQAFCPDILNEYEYRARIPKRNLWMAEQCDMAITYVNHDESTIYQPLDHMYQMEKAFVRLGDYEPRVRLFWWQEKE